MASRTVTIEPTNQEVLELFTVLSSFEGRRRRIGEGEQTEIITEPFELDMDVRWDIALNQNTIKKSYDTIMDTRANVIKQVSGGKQSIPKFIKNEEGVEVSNPIHEEFEEKFGEELKKSAGKFKMIVLDKKRLNADKNKFSPTMLRILMPLTDQNQEIQEEQENE